VTEQERELALFALRTALEFFTVFCLFQSFECWNRWRKSW
jgi:hypothetical protein